MTYSLAHRFLCQRTKSTLPMSATLLGQSVPPVAGVQDEHQGRRAKAKTYYDKTANRDHHRGDECGYGEVLEEVTPRSYVIRTQDGLIRRNRSHIRLAEHSQKFDHQSLKKHKAKIGVGSVAEKLSEATKSMSISEGETPAESPQMKTSLRCRRFVMVE